MWNYNYYVYITTNHDKTVLYIGVTNDLNRRLYEHREHKGTGKSFTAKYYCYNLVYYEHFSKIEYAIEREKEIKKWRREKKNALIKATNPDWKFLNNEIDK
ncbi:GIY-YIG nuclease family protein [Mucilaginibacter phyllosphaerae]|uniref:Endonuclease n=1 Tax=Mucilaginibacter phyllosphaerae TaxID=1812349 RepID=A0A4Y8AJC3_9SPHI|nr:GIY-YIG nuclease family protein [Mucilaginibacter phyllosphaerae]MBB3967827.1 putative endonuclease [Mucilaginibacter phyllosphaerae]TEW69128.1 GIY-YIG nuclease family protein [Mucilaginibacter phyllosphaerae]GGH03039.1 endonuclease [Mucilaginibacter phyllosphaerae]